MGFRKRFTADEKAAFTVGAAVEWQNGSHWHPAEITDGPSQDRMSGWWRVTVRHTGRRTDTIAPGQSVECLPGKVRLPIV